MSSNELVEQIMAQVIARVATPEQQAIPTENHPIRETAMAEKSCSLTEFVGTAIGDTLGLVIANVDTALLDAMKLEKRYRSIGILGARTGAGPHIMAADEAVKATNTEVVSIELPRDTKGGAGHGSLIILGGNDVSDVKRGIEVALKELDRTFGDVYGNEAGQFTFYRIPKILVTSPTFKRVSDSAKLLYGLMLDRMGLSIRNGWVDDENRAYIFFTTNDVMEQMCCGTEKATKLLAELDGEKGIGLIERKKQGQGKPAIIYLKKFYISENNDRDLRLSEIESQDF